MRFFFYGTLIAGSGNPAATAAHALLRDLGAATTEGHLHAIPDPLGWYPALLPGAGTVHGRLYEAGPAFGEPELVRLDAYEDFDPGDTLGSLYLRETIGVSGGGEAQAYRFNQPLPAAARPIPGGDFFAWLQRERLRPYGAVS
jgi:gamma-glutamylcyclotransferase (GGCT)/AIG2-like uncharacterized protein YtfP